MEKEFHYKNIILSYTVWGAGPEILLAFHGFGLSKYSFKPFQSIEFEKYTIYSFDLFFHGKSKWDNTLPVLTKSFWKEIQLAFFAHEKIDRFSMVGYSMGGKFVLANLEAFPERINKIILIAPDGVTINFWYKFATYPSLTRALFKKTIDTPIIFEKLIKVIGPLKIINKSLLKFAETQMDTKEKREKVYFSWVVFRQFKFDINRISDLINQHKIDLEVFLGKYDKMIKKKHLEKLLKRVHRYKLEILEAGHNRLVAEVADYLKKELL